MRVVSVIVLGLVVLLTLAACAIKVRSLQIDPVEADAATSQLIETPVKAHLHDGSTVVFTKGVLILENKLSGDGVGYDLGLRSQGPVTELSLDDVAAIESFQTPIHSGATAAASTAASAGTAGGGLFILKAIFGSCPTTYSLDGDEPVLEAESFSYSIAPGFEYRDVDRLGIDGGPRPDVTLEMRNEALETHYINRVELLAVAHRAGESVYTDPDGRALVVESPRQALTVGDNSGRDVRAELALADGAAWRTPAGRLDRVSADDFDDFLELAFDRPPGRPVLVLRLRNSLLNTVLLYEVMLARQGFRAIDWMARDLTRVLPRWRLARWYRNTMGLRVAVLQRGRWRQVAAIDDTGPIAWKDIGVELPAIHEDVLRVRLEFVSDNWRIDHAALGSLSRVATFEPVPLAAIEDATGARHTAAEANLLAADERYVITRPAEYLRLRFDTSGLPADSGHTYFLAATGYYIEWLRRDWLQTSTRSAFEPGDAAVLDALGRWRTQRDTLRARFDGTRINVR